MKLIIVLLLLFVLIAVVFVKYRRQIQTALYVWKMFKNMRQMSTPQEENKAEIPQKQNTDLIRCAKCGTWTPQDSAFNRRSQTKYCSAKCMEQAVKL